MKFLEIVGVWALGLFLPVLAYLQLVYFVTFADFVLGVTAAWMVGEKLSLLKMSRLLGKWVMFTFFLAAIFHIQKMLSIPAITVGSSEFNVVLMVAGIIAVTELKSMAKNIEKAFGISLWSWFTEKVPFLKNFETTPTTNTPEIKEEVPPEVLK